MKFTLLPLLPLLALLLGMLVHAPQPRPVSDPGTAAFHRTHLGQVLFGTTAVPVGAYASPAHLPG